MKIPKQIEITCCSCNKKVKKPTSAVNYAKKNNKPLYCGYSCSNKSRTVLNKLTCNWCNKKFIPKRNIKFRKFCSFECGGFFIGNERYLSFIKNWKMGTEDGCTCLKGHKISSYLRKYLFDKYQNSCCECGWSVVHPVTGLIPLEVDHIDGNCTNNAENNLRLVCPNCHSLSPTYRALNKGNGRR